jgi:hypothetical protein
MAEPIELLFDTAGKLKMRSALYAACFVVPLLLICDVSIYVYGTINKSATGEAAELQYIREHWQPGDVMLATDQQWINISPYAPGMPIYLIPGCSNSLGRLSDSTRKALGAEFLPDDLKYSHAWVLWQYTPLTLADPDCPLKRYSLTDPVLLVSDGESVYSGLWVTK